MFRIVIVEDEPPILRSIKEKIALADPDFKVVGEYNNGEAALLEMDILKPHVLITDLRMPVMDGPALLERVREAYPDVVCVILSGYQNFEDARMAIRRGITDYLLKPPTEETIAELLSGVKAKLLQNQSLVESEILQSVVFPGRHAQDGAAKTEKWAREFFYHANYVLLYGWLPPELQREIPKAALLANASGSLRGGEKLYPISSLANEIIALLGVHDSQAERLREFETSIRHAAEYESVSFALLPADGWITKVPGLLVSARKTALAHNRPGRASVALGAVGGPGRAGEQEDAAAESGRIAFPAHALGHLSAYLRKRKKTEFEKQFDAMVAASGLEASTRLVWIKTLQRLVQQLEAGAEPPIPTGKARSMELEIEQAVWGSLRAADIASAVRLVFERLFEDSDEAESADWLSEVEAYLRANYVSNVSLTDLSDKFKLNPSYLSYVFKSKKNKSPTDYVVELRVEEAKRLIREFPRLLFKDIAEQVGYPDPYYFSKLFKQWTGSTPTEYKRSQAIPGG